MNDTPPRPPATRTAGEKDRTRVWSLAAAGLFVPTVLLVLVITYSSGSASRCLTYGQECGWQPPEWMLPWSLGMAAAACLTTLAAPTVRVRRAGLSVQLIAQGTVLVAFFANG
ncbi:hypothetical protein [Streptomyces sp. NPDC020965]|uniref:hypothetical protein n=1 Tax=Streptomyces sp. NPDC020965 TaxID=3365105 RepID=UPI0037A8AE29